MCLPVEFNEDVCLCLLVGREGGWGGGVSKTVGGSLHVRAFGSVGVYEWKGGEGGGNVRVFGRDVDRVCKHRGRKERLTVSVWEDRNRTWERGNE